ncbi:gamma-glutamyltransferase [Gemmatimonadota bacterium]
MKVRFKRTITLSLAIVAAITFNALASHSPASQQQAEPVQESWRQPAMGNHGAVTAGHPLAAQAGLEVLQDGGNAIDAVVAMAGVLAVVRPHMNGIGGDTFMLIYDAADGQVHGLNGSGRAGSLADADDLRNRGLSQMPGRGLDAVTVPGTVSAWAAAASRFGSRRLSALMRPAILTAFGGFPVTPKLAADLQASSSVISESSELSRIFKPNGTLLEVGDLLIQENLGNSLRMIAESNGTSFYQGELAGTLADYFATNGGLITRDDLANHTADWVTPLVTSYRGLDVHVLPPNTQGIALLMGLNLLEQFDMDRFSATSPEYLHLLIEAKKLAFADRDEHVADPAGYEAPIDSLISKLYAGEQAGRIDPQRAAVEVGTGQARRFDDDTVVCTATDIQGNVVVLIQSLFNAFGSGEMAGSTGIILQNRGALFSLEPGHPNELQAGRRSYHTLCPTLIMRDGTPVLGLATPGGDGQVQTLMQVINNWHIFDMNIQQAIEAPRFRSYDGLDVSLEDSVGLDTISALESRGHRLRLFWTGQSAAFGGAQGIVILQSGAAGVLYMAGADPRREAIALAW